MPKRDMRSRSLLALVSLILLSGPLLFAAERLAGSLEALRQRFSIRQSSISSLQVRGKGTKEIWEGVLQSSSLPSTVSLQVSLPVEGDRFAVPEGLAERMERVAALPFAVPWFKAFVEQHPGIEVILRFETDRSLPPEWLHMFVHDMNQGNAEQKALGGEVERAAAEVTFLQVRSSDDRWSRWIVFPDRRMVLWDYHGDGVLEGRVPACSLMPCRVGALATAEGRFP
jgi:hypothetical protein